MHVLFDLDGTLTDPFEGITRSMSHALAALGRRAPAREDLRWCIGPPIRSNFQKLLDSDEPGLIEKAVALYRDRYSSLGLFENDVYAGIPEALHALKGTGHALYIASSKPTEYSERIVSHFGLRHFFDGVYGSEMDGTRSDKPTLISHVLQEESIESRDAVMVGDREHDMMGGHANGVTGVGVLWGYGTREELETSGAFICISHPRELLPTVRNLDRTGPAQD